MIKQLFRHIYLSLRRSAFFEGTMIIKALKVVGALLLLGYVIALGIVVDNLLFQIKPQNITDVICCIMGFGFIFDFLLRLCLVKNKLYFFSGYATLPISRRKMLWLSVFLNTLSYIMYLE